MAAPRHTSFRALKQLSSTAGQVRRLHITGPSTFPSHILNADKSVTSSLPKDLAGLRAECKKRSLKTSGNKADLVERLNKDSLRAYSSKRPTLDSSAEVNFSATPVKHQPTTNNATRTFNTSRSARTRGDSSTIDFAYMPSFPLSFSTTYDDEDPNSSDPYAQADVPTDPFGLTPWQDTAYDTIVRVPILPQTMNPVRDSVSIEGDTPFDVHVPTIALAAGEATYVESPSPMAEMSDGHGEIEEEVNEVWDFSIRNLFGVGEAKAENKEPGIFAEVFQGMMDDLFGPRKITIK